MKWALENPRVGVVEPEEIDFQFVMRIAEPYLGKMVGQYTDWNPIQKKEGTLSEALEDPDPWQFHHIRVKN